MGAIIETLIAEPALGAIVGLTLLAALVGAVAVWRAFMDEPPSWR